MEAVCRVLAALLTWLGVVGFAVYLLWEFSHPFSVMGLFVEPLTELMATANREQLSAERLSRLATGLFSQHAPEWLTWYYSPLNLRHWAVALLCFAPALGMYLWARYLAWRRQIPLK